MFSKVNCLLLVILCTSPNPASGLDQLDPHSEGGEGDEEGGGGVLLFRPEGQGGQGGGEGELQLDLGGQGGREGVHDPHIEDGDGQGVHGGGEGVLQLDPPGRGGGVGQACGGPRRQWGGWGGRWKST